MSEEQPNGPMRAGTADRDATAARLNDAYAEGRLTADEHDDRMTRCYAAVTMADLAALTTDLPTGPPPLPPAPPGVPAATPEHLAVRSGRAGVKAMWFSWLGVSIFMVAIWLLGGMDGDLGSFWPAWVIVPWGAVNLMVMFTSWGRGDS